MENNVNLAASDDEEILDWQTEAAAIINDVKSHVQEIRVSERLPSNNFEIFLNLKSLERKDFCVRVSSGGFQVAGKAYDQRDCLTDNPEDFYETPYALLNAISPGYVQSFANKLSEQMSKLT